EPGQGVGAGRHHWRQRVGQGQQEGRIGLEQVLVEILRAGGARPQREGTGEVGPVIDGPGQPLMGVSAAHRSSTSPMSRGRSGTAKGLVTYSDAPSSRARSTSSAAVLADTTITLGAASISES